MELVLGTVVLMLFLTGSLCCDINKCQTNATPFSPAACATFTKHLDCLKTEFTKCTNDGAKNSFMIMVPYSMQIYRPAFCGYDMDQIQQMFMARVGLMNTMMNGTHGIPPVGLGDDGPFDDSDSIEIDDDGPLDDGPFDDGPFDDGPFDDGPFDDAGENGMIHAVLAAGANAGKTQTEKPPPAPGLLPTFRGGAAMQREDDDNSRSAAVLLRLSLTLGILVPTVFVLFV